MKNNNKGVTLIELIVAFAIVSVATIYFFQTVSLVKRMYANAREETNNYTNKTYAMRIVDRYIDQYGTIGLKDGKVCSQLLNGYCDKIEFEDPTVNKKDLFNNTFLFKLTATKNSNTLFTLYKYATIRDVPLPINYGDDRCGVNKYLDTTDNICYEIASTFTPYWGGWSSDAKHTDMNIDKQKNVFRITRRGGNASVSSSLTFPIKYSGNVRVNFRITTDDPSKQATGKVTLVIIKNSGEEERIDSDAKACNLVSNQCKWNANQEIKFTSSEQNYKVKLEFTRTGGGSHNTIYIGIDSIENF